MSRSGYSDDCGGDNWSLICWRGAVASAIRGYRGQAFLQEMRAALDAMPDRKLIKDRLATEDGAVCAIGAVGKARGVDMHGIDPEDYERVARAFGISDALAREIVWMNDDAFYSASPEERFTKMREWIDGNIRKPIALWAWA